MFKKRFMVNNFLICFEQNAAAFCYKTNLWACEFERSDVAGDQGTEKENLKPQFNFKHYSWEGSWFWEKSEIDDFKNPRKAQS